GAIGQHLEGIEDHLRGIAAARFLAVDAHAHVELARVAELTCRDDPWPHRAKGREVLGVRIGLPHLHALALAVARRYVVADRVAEYVVGGLAGADVAAVAADDQRELVLLV